MNHSSTLQGTLLLALLTGLLLPAPAAAQTEAQLAEVRQHLDRGEGEQALALIESVLGKRKPTAEVLLLRSTAEIMVGRTAEGARDLRRALKLDPGLRQGWLNLAGLEIAEGSYEAAYEALLEAQKLDPAAADNHLNLGAVLIMQGQVAKAADHFDQYLARQPESAEAYYLVASNYALGGNEDRVVTHLRRAIALDERMRLRARSDNRFAALEGGRYRRLLNTDSYVPPAGSHTVAAAFEVPYRRPDPKLVYAVLDALKDNGEHYDPTVEATDHWALIWAEMRIKLYNQADGTGVVSLSAPADAFTADEWHRRTQALFRSIHLRLEQSWRDELGLEPK